MKKKILLLIFIVNNLFSQNAYDLDLTFNPGTGIPSGTRIRKSIFNQNENKIYCVGTFTTFNGLSYNKLVRLNIDGSVDNTLNIGTGFNGETLDVIIQDDGKIIVGGDFTSYNGIQRNGLVRLNSNGTIDNTLNIGTGFLTTLSGTSTHSIRTLALDNNKIIVGGNFIYYNGTLKRQIIRLNNNGSIDNTFNIGTGLGGGNGVTQLIVDSNGKILMCGEWGLYNNVQVLSKDQYIIRLNPDGSKDDSFNTSGTGFNNQFVNHIAIQDNIKFIITGNFISYNGFANRGIIRLNYDGSIDNSFDYSGGGISSSPTWGMVFNSLLLNNKIYIVGSFQGYNNNPLNGIAKLSTDGLFDSNFSVNPYSNYSEPEIFNITSQADDILIISGAFITINGSQINGIARLKGDSILSSDLFKRNISMYPNPVNEILNLDLSNIETIEKLTIYDVTGKNILEIKDISNHQIDVSSLDKGVYFIDIKTQNGSFKEKFVKN